MGLVQVRGHFLGLVKVSRVTFLSVVDLKMKVVFRGILPVGRLRIRVLGFLLTASVGRGQLGHSSRFVVIVCAVHELGIAAAGIESFKGIQWYPGSAETCFLPG